MHSYSFFLIKCACVFHFYIIFVHTYLVGRRMYLFLLYSKICNNFSFKYEKDQQIFNVISKVKSHSNFLYFLVPLNKD